MPSKIYVHSCAWMSYVDLYYKYTLPSLEDDIERLKAEGYEIEFNRCCFDMKELPPLHMSPTGNITSDIILKELRDIIKRSRREKAIVFMAFPDTIYSKGTMYNLVKLQEGKNIHIAFPHLRVCEDENLNPKVTGRELVNQCFQFPHGAFSNCFDTDDNNGTQWGIAVRKLDDKTYTMIHSLPTVYLARFTEKDDAFWNNCTCFGNWDRNWTYMLWREQRIKVIGDSDVAFAAEITKKDSNVPPSATGLLNNDHFYFTSDNYDGFNHFISTIKR